MNNSPRKHAGISWFILGTGILLAVIGAMTAKAYKVNPCLLTGALVIIGGLTASTILTLILIPTFYLIFDKRSRQERRAAKKLAKSQRSGKTGDAENE